MLIRSVFVTLLIMGSHSAFAEKELQVVAGAGPSTNTVTLFMDLLKDTETGKNYRFVVPQKSAKHKGGINNTKRFIFGRTGRPLNAKEKELDIEELHLARVSISIVVGEKVGVNTLSSQQVCDLFTGKVKNWKEVGGNNMPVVLFSREPGEALFLQLKKDLPCVRDGIKTKYIYKKDHQMLAAFYNLAAGKQAIGFGPSTYYPKKYLVKVPDLSSGVANGLVFSKKNSDHPLVSEARRLVASKEWKQVVAEMGLLLP